MKSQSRLRTIGRFDLVEVVLISLVACAAVGSTMWQLGRRAGQPTTYGDFLTQRQASDLRQRFGPGRNSEHEEEWVVRDFFKDRRGGVFVDVGANHFKNGSNTYYLESRLGWSGIAVDPQRGFASDYEKYRPRTRFFPFFVSDVSHQEAKLYVLQRNLLVSSSDPAFVKDFGSGARETQVPAIILTDLLDLVKLSTFDFLSIDVELAEPKVLSGFAIERFKPALVCIEAHPQVRQQILDYFALHHYVVVGEYLRVDTQNLYFKPLR